MRILLFTGKGGVGKTTAAAATGTLAAVRGLRTLVMSADIAHSLSDTFEMPIGPAPTEVDDRLYVQQVDTQQLFERNWREIRRYLLALFDGAGFAALEAEEMVVLPGAEEVLALLELRRQTAAAEWDVVVVDCAPTAETLRLLALPELLLWYLERVIPPERGVLRGLAPVLSRATGIPLPDDATLDGMARLGEDLKAVRAILENEKTSVRLVLTPESVVLAEARQAFTTLAMLGYRVDGVVANRVFPAGGADPWRQQWVAAQAVQLAEVAESFGAVPVWQSRYQAFEPVGVEALATFAAEMYGGMNPFAVRETVEPLTVETYGEGWVLRLALPFVERGEVGLLRRGKDLVVSVGSRRRILALPGALRRAEVAGARLHEGQLWVRFVPALDEGADDEAARLTEEEA